MKKFLALLAALLMLGAVAFAQEETIPSEEMLQFDAMVEAVPEGWTLDRSEGAAEISMTMYRDLEEDAKYLVSISPSEEFAGYTLKVELGEEELKNLTELLTADYYHPTVSIKTTDYGTSVVCIEENDAQTDTAELITVWNGYFIGITIVKNSEITAEDVDRGMKLMSDLWVFNKFTME